MKNTAHNNTLIYRKLWGCYPDDKYVKFKEIPKKSNKNKKDLEELINNYQKEKNGIIGQIVEFPLHFLEKENLSIKFFSIEHLVPEVTYT